MFGSLLGDLVRIAAAPIQVAAHVVAPVLDVTVQAARVVTKPVADAAQEVVKTVGGR
ncbi:hypothetical protein SCYZ1_25 [Pseudomonas phage SCYZ1]|nr:hypothetical protein SCYZ1_25 [Pseudomonas phage SCYZ1]